MRADTDVSAEVFHFNRLWRSDEPLSWRSDTEDEPLDSSHIGEREDRLEQSDLGLPAAADEVTGAAWSRVLTPNTMSDLRANCSQWPARICSMVCCLAILVTIAFLFAFLYIILKDLRGEQLTANDGSEIKLLGFWTLLVLSCMAGLSCWGFSWTLTYFDSIQPGGFAPTPVSLPPLRPTAGHHFHMGYSVAILNGVVAALTVIWCLA